LELKMILQRYLKRIPVFSFFSPFDIFISPKFCQANQLFNVEYFISTAKSAEVGHSRKH